MGFLSGAIPPQPGGQNQIRAGQPPMGQYGHQGSLGGMDARRSAAMPAQQNGTPQQASPLQQAIGNAFGGHQGNSQGISPSMPSPPAGGQARVAHPEWGQHPKWAARHGGPMGQPMGAKGGGQSAPPNPQQGRMQSWQSGRGGM
jgi:hypothetical protein